MHHFLDFSIANNLASFGFLAGPPIVGSLFLLVGSAGFLVDTNTKEAGDIFLESSTCSLIGRAGYYGDGATGFVRDAEEIMGIVHRPGTGG